MKAKIGTVLINYDSKDVLRKTLASLQRQTSPSHFTVVVDNDSEDGSVAMVESEFPDIRLIKEARNYGMVATNDGIRYALDHGCDYLFIDDSDGICEPDVLEKLAAVLDSAPDIGIAGPAFYEIGCAPIMSMRKQDYVFIAQSHTTVPAETAGIGISMVKREVYEKIGMVDPAYFAYYQDSDFCERAKKAGYRTFIVPAAKLHHEGSHTTRRVRGLKGFVAVRNRCIFFRKNYPLRYGLLFALKVPKETVQQIGRWVLERRPEEIPPMLVGALSGFFYLMRGKEPEALREIGMALMRRKVFL